MSTVFSNMSRFHADCEQRARKALGTRGFDAAFRRGQAMSANEAIGYALEENTVTTTRTADTTRALTKREQQVAKLVALGLSNKQIATKLVISQRTAEGHVEHILGKLGFTSRAQIAASIARETKGRQGP
ncbi:helix-turn-helix transcriptional regulator [Nocardia sp. NPDC052254]|uniref:response regulator transcription factor n=1 Tax=Nocardia sp. NPDC052254 TaxID=3155681 RepID=UPI0034199A12